MSALFGNLSNIAAGNPFSTLVGQRIEQATDQALASEDWGLYMEVCDIINGTEEGPKDAVRAIRKRLQNNAGKNHTVVMYTLTLLETCVKNCGKRLHVLIASKDFCQEVVKIIQPKNEPPQVVQDKVLSLLQMWADTFRGQPDMKGVVDVYNELKAKGIEFPMTDLDTLSPIHTPAASGPTVHEEPDAAAVRRSSAQPAPPVAQVSAVVGSRDARPVANVRPTPPTQTPPAPGPVNLNTEQLAKLRSELEIVCANIRVFSDMLTTLTPLDVAADDLQLLQDLNKTCREMQSRIVELINTVNNEEVTEELLRVNDDLNNTFIRYDRFERYRTGRAGMSPDDAKRSKVPPPPVLSGGMATAAAGGGVSQAQEPSLINFSDDTSGAAKPDDIHVQLAGLDFGSKNVSSTLSAMPSNQTSTGASGSTYADNSNIEQHQGLASALNKKINPKDKELDYDEMEGWLSNDQAGPEGAAGATMTSSEFDRFLAERAAAADHLPPATGSEPRQAPDGPGKDKEEMNSLFAL